MRNVLEVCEAYGGGVKTHLDYIDKYLGKSFKIYKIVSSKRGAEVPQSYIIDDRMSAINNPFKIFSVIRHIRKIVKENDIDLIHAHSTIAGVIISLYCVFYKSNVRVLFTPHAYYSEVNRGRIKNKLVELIERYMNSKFDLVIHVSDEEEDYALSRNLVSKSKSVVVKNGVPLHNEIIKKDEKHLKINIVNVARCGYQKDPDLFISIAEKILKKIPNCVFIWVGDGPDLERCRNQVTEKGLRNSIRFVGYSGTPSDYLEQADIFLSTSRYEGLPFSVLEALSFGLPLILTDIIGHKELVDNNGFLLNDTVVATGNLEELFSETIKNKYLFSQNSYELCKRSFSLKSMLLGIENIYN